MRALIAIFALIFSGGCAVQSTSPQERAIPTAMTPKVSPAQLAESERTGICCVHHVSMKKRVTSVRYGFLVVPPGAGGDIERDSFPFAERHLYGGHALGPPWSGEILICDDCSTAKTDWIRLHPRDPWAIWWLDDMKKPNKAPEPTTTSVTSPAAQEPRQP